MNKEKIKCPCCNNATLPKDNPWYFICPICLWENDPVQFADPNFEGGANECSLIQAKENFEKLKK